MKLFLTSPSPVDILAAGWRLETEAAPAGLTGLTASRAATTFSAIGATPVECFDDLRRRISSFDSLELAVAEPDNPSSPEDLRAKGWVVAVHNDYRLAGQAHTFWLFTNKHGRAVRGEGKSDAEALNKIRALLAGGREPDLSLADLYMATVHFLMDCDSPAECLEALQEQLDPLTLRYAPDPNATAILEWRIAPGGEPAPHNGDGFYNEEPFETA